MTSTVQRSLKLLREAGWTCQIVERWNAFAKVRQDLYGFGDIIACGPSGIMLVQTTSGAHVAERLAKVKAEPRAKAWYDAGGMIVVHGWAKRGPRGKAKKWEVRIEEVHFREEKQSGNAVNPK